MKLMSKCIKNKESQLTSAIFLKNRVALAVNFPDADDLKTVCCRCNILFIKSTQQTETVKIGLQK